MSDRMWVVWWLGEDYDGAGDPIAVCPSEDVADAVAVANGEGCYSQPVPLIASPDQVDSWDLYTVSTGRRTSWSMEHRVRMVTKRTARPKTSLTGPRSPTVAARAALDHYDVPEVSAWGTDRDAVERVFATLCRRVGVNPAPEEWSE